MNRLSWLIGVLLAAAWLAPASAQVAYKDTDGPFRVDLRDDNWHDAARDRHVPVRIFTPVPIDEDATKPRRYPLVVFSHGLGGSREGYPYIAIHLASHGYIVILPTHAGSDTRAMVKSLIDRRLKDRPRGKDRPRETAEPPKPEEAAHEGLIAEGVSDPDNLRNRPRDISFIIDQVKKDAKLGPLVDMDRIGVAGHSFGAYTSLAVAGMTVDLPEGADGGKAKSFRDSRVKAVIAMSPQGEGVMGIARSSWDRVAVPVLTLTGTKDYGQGERAASWRREPFDAIKGVDDYLAVIKDATHMTFADNAGLKYAKNAQVSPDHAKHIRYIKMLSVAFFDAYLRGDGAAKKWLVDGEITEFDHRACAFEQKLKKEEP